MSRARRFLLLHLHVWLTLYAVMIALAFALYSGNLLYGIVSWTGGVAWAALAHLYAERRRV